MESSEFNQCASTIMLIRPANFGFNEETASSNSFQKSRNDNNLTDISNLAIAEFNHFTDTLIQHGIGTIIIDDTPLPIKPDAIFPNNWISTHSDGTIVLYPMFAPNRRMERRADIVALLKENYDVNRIIDWSHHENQGIFLEGTGSIVFDHNHKTAFACSSPRTNKELFLELCDLLEYTPVYFKALDNRQNEIYHCNVVMNIGEHFAIVCLDCIPSLQEKALVIEILKKNNLHIIPISIDQMMQFAGNMLSVQNQQKVSFLVMSQTAFKSLSSKQKQEINLYAQCLPVNIPTIESIGGGSARCMMAEIFLPGKVTLLALPSEPKPKD